MAVINLIGGPYAPPRPRFENAFDKETIVTLTDVCFVLSFFFWNNNEPIREADSKQKLAILHQHDNLLKILLAFEILLIVSISCINVSNCISSFDCLRDVGAFPI